MKPYRMLHAGTPDFINNSTFIPVAKQAVDPDAL